MAAEEEAAELRGAADDDAHLRRLLHRRLAGEPLAWVTGTAAFCGLTVSVAPGVYVPRWQSEPMARLAADRLPDDGVAVDLCTGSGAIGMVLRAAHPRATVVGTELDPVAAACARRNGLVVVEGDLDGALPPDLAGRVDVLVGVLPYVPDHALRLLPRDVLAYEPLRALDGGADGLARVGPVVARSPRWVRPGGWLLLEVGGGQDRPVADLYRAAGYRRVDVLEDEDGDPRAVVGQLRPG